MTIRNLTVRWTVFVVLAAVAVVFVPLTSSLAERSIDDGRNATGGLEVKQEPGAQPGTSDALARKPSTYARSNYIWPYASGPSYTVADPYAKDVVWTPAGLFQLEQNLDIAGELRTEVRLAGQSKQIFVVQYDIDVANEDDLAAVIASGGGQSLGTPNSGSMIARLSHAAYAAVQGAAGVLAIEPYHAAFKLDPTIGRAPLPDPMQALSDVYALEVQLWPGEDGESAAKAVREIGGNVRQNFGDTLIVELDRTLLAKLAQIDAVMNVHEMLPNVMLGEETTCTMQTGQFNGGAIPYHSAGVTGAGLNLCSNNLAQACTVATEVANCGGVGLCIGPQVMMILDSGFQLDAGDLSATRTNAGTPSTAHRKVRVTEPTDQFGGQGDSSGCDAPAQGGFTHGHVVAATALGNATAVATGTYGLGWIALDQQGNDWNLDGVAPGAVLVGYDGQVTPPNGSCSDPLLDSIVPGDLYNSAVAVNGACPGANCPGSLGKAFEQHKARIVNFSWGSTANTYTAGAQDIDQWMRNKGTGLVFVSAGNQGDDIVPAGGDGIPDPGTLGAPATTKNGFAIGASRNANTVNSPESRAFFSSCGPAIDTTINRTAPQLMAPGDEPGGGALGLASEFSCRSQDNNQTNPVQCDIISGVEGTSFSAPAAAGAALLVRDYFRQGFHPDGKQTPSKGFDVGAATVKAVLIASADFMTGENLTRAHRWNNEQGYGRIQLDHALPLEAWSRSPTGLLITDPISAKADINLPFTVSTNTTHSTTFQVVNDDEELRVALAWIDEVPAGTTGTLRNDLNLKLISPSGIEYRGNYFTDDNDQDGIPEIGEDCGGIGAANVNVANGLIDEDQWSLPICNLTQIIGKSTILRPFDNSNPTEAIFLSDDPEGDDTTTNGLEGTCTPTSTANANGPCDNNLDCRLNPPGLPGQGECVNPGDYKQTELGTWKIFVSSGEGTISGAQQFAVAIAGGVSLGSTVRFDRGDYSCNQAAVITVTEVLDSGVGGTDNPTEANVESRVTVEVRDSTNTLVDSETGLNFTKQPGALLFVSDKLQMTDKTARQPNNGALDVRDGDKITVVYTDADVDIVGKPLTLIRKNGATVTCRVDVGFGSIVFAQYGQDSSLLVQGGCERNARNQFEFGFPDRYMDADESIILNFAFNSNESEDLESVVASLRCVNVDNDSPKDCLPSGAGCDPNTAPPQGCGGPCDPRRENNTTCPYMTILDSPKVLGFIPAGGAMSANFSIQMAGDGAGEPFAGQPTPTVEMVLEIKADVSGNGAGGIAVSRQKLNVDAVTSFYSTDYPDGGTEVLDFGPGTVSNNDEIALNPITENGNFQGNDYRFETFVFSSLKSGGKNLNLKSPWNFDGNNGGFTNGLAAPADETAANIFKIANWGEDKNFNGIEDGVCAALPDVACYQFGSNTDPRCPANTACNSVENNAAGSSFTNNWSTKGGCGWQTWATGECTGDATRGCFVNADCKGTCQVINNAVASTFTACDNTPQCPNAKQCNDLADFPRAICTVNADCGNGGVNDTCVSVGQQCLNAAGTCGAVSGLHTGGVWHTGPIGLPTDACNGQQPPTASACSNYKIIGGGTNTLTWWELLVTPVMNKVNQGVGGDGLPLATIEMFDMGWNANVNLKDANAAYTWEIDTDLDTLAPVDLFADTTILGLGGGAYGAINPGSNPDLTGGWPVFATQCKCSNAPQGTCTSLFQCNPGSCTVSGDPCHVDADCGLGQTCAGAPTCVCTGGQSTNGTLGNSRVGDAGCFFEGKIATAVFPDLGTAQPLDDDIDNDSDAAIDEFVQDDGPFRNNDLVIFNGPDMRFLTLEDIYGDTGNTFQAALGFITFEGTPSSQAQQSYGLAVDDLVVKWKEFTLNPDVTDCAVSGSCAVLEVGATNVFQGQAVLTITVLDSVPDAANDCDLDGVPDGTQNCGGNPNPDVVVKATSDAELTGEIVFLDKVSGSQYKGTLAISSLADSPGTLYISQQGTNLPTVTVTYLDNDINPGAPVQKCPNNVDPTKHGILQTFTTVFLGNTCEILVVDFNTTDNGDHDTFVDTEETVDMQFCIINNCNQDLHNCTGHIFSNSPTVDCILDSTIDMGDIPDSPAVVCLTDKFKWKMANLSRPNTAADFNAKFTFTMSCDEIDALSSDQVTTMQLDLDLSGAGAPVQWTEGFESGSLGTSKFVAENLDAGIPGNNNTEGLINGDGWRCQYSNPDFPNSNSYGNAIGDDCYPGATLAGSNAIYWKVDGFDTGSPNGGRAKTGSYSGYYGVYLTDPAGEFTTPLADVESIATSGIINLGAAPELNWWQQISLLDGRFLNIADSRSSDRGVVEYREFNAANNPIGQWTRLEPFQNKYDTQAYDFYFNCMFDPVDDGNNEDDFFDPSDPERRLGPSSTCHPGFNYSCIGDTALAFGVDHLCNATVAPAPADQGALGTGTWVQTKVNMKPLKGRRIKLRFLASAIKATSETADGQFTAVNPGDWDNGWWIDDVKITETLANPATLAVDSHVVHHCTGNVAVGCLTNTDCTNAGVAGPCTGAAPQCGPTCTSITAAIKTTPDVNGGVLTETLTAPGQPIELDASGSSGTCIDGVLQYKFAKDNGATVIREFSENPILVDVPDYPSEQYVVTVRCSTATNCSDTETALITVNCPDGTLAEAAGNIFRNVLADCDAGPVDTAPCSISNTNAVWFWPAASPYEYCRLNDKAALTAYNCSLYQAGLNGSSYTEGAPNPAGYLPPVDPTPNTPPFPNLAFYLFKGEGEFCNAGGTWSEGGNELPGRDSGLP